ncbi:MAG: hypothetical protein JWP63_531 [Candidatus Solibacter sp.]|nr:hypothetical protein [Candidatus Solibacter sp.]
MFIRIVGPADVACSCAPPALYLNSSPADAALARPPAMFTRSPACWFAVACRARVAGGATSLGRPFGRAFSAGSSVRRMSPATRSAFQGSAPDRFIVRAERVLLILPADICGARSVAACGAATTERRPAGRASGLPAVLRPCAPFWRTSPVTRSAFQGSGPDRSIVLTADIRGPKSVVPCGPRPNTGLLVARASCRRCYVPHAIRFIVRAERVVA